MNKMEVFVEGAKLMSEIAKNLHSLADSVQALCTLIADGFSEEKEEPKIEEKKKPVITLENVRGILAEKSRTGHTAEVKEIIAKYGAEKLSEINPESYEAIIEEAEKL